MQHPVLMDQKQTLAIQNFSPKLTFVAEFRMHLTASELEIPPDAKECNPGFAFSPSSRKSGERPGEGKRAADPDRRAGGRRDRSRGDGEDDEDRPERARATGSYPREDHPSPPWRGYRTEPTRG